MLLVSKWSIPIGFAVTIFNIPVMLILRKTRYNKRVIKTVRHLRHVFLWAFLSVNRICGAFYKIRN